MEDNNAELLYNKALAYYEEKKINLAIDYFNKAIEVEPNRQEFYYNLAGAHYYRKEYDKAIENYKKSLTFDEKDIHSYQNLGNIYFAIKDFDSALETFQKILHFYPDNDDAMHSVGDVYCKKNEYGKAITEYEKALNINPTNLAAKEALAFATKLHDKEIAEKEEEEARIASRPKETYLNEFMSAEAYFNLGINYTKVQNFELSIESFKKCLKIDPDYPRAYDFIDNIINRLGTENQAKTAIEHIKAAAGYVANGYSDIAKDTIRRAININPNLPDAYFILGMIHFNNKNLDFAKDSLQKCTELDPNHAKAKEYMYKIIMESNTNTNYL